MLRNMAQKLTLNSTVKLRSGYELPLLGFGVSISRYSQITSAKKSTNVSSSGLSNVKPLKYTRSLKKKALTDRVDPRSKSQTSATRL